MREYRINVLHDTLETCARGSYPTDRNTVQLKLDNASMKTVQVLLPDQIEKLRMRGIPKGRAQDQSGRCSYSCENTDSFNLARQLADKYPEEKILVLNLANSIHPGGGVRKGAKAQEEDLCRQSSLLLSLESQEAASYYKYNESLKTYNGSDAIIITPDVEIFKDQNYEYLEKTTVVSVMTCAAPRFLEPPKKNDFEYREMMYHRIEGMLVCAAALGYKRLVLGAFGCGAFNNDAAVVSNIFFDVCNFFKYDGLSADELFSSIDFAVLSSGKSQYNFDEFWRNFGDSGSAIDRRKIVEENKSHIVGFWHEYDDYGCLSNWYKTEFRYAGKIYTSVEQFMMYHKLMTFRQYELAEKVMKTDDPAKAKSIGRTRFSNFDDKLWTRISSTIVKRAVRAKFEQNPELLNKLLSTGNAVLAECSPFDTIWGIGLAPNDSRICITSEWKGKNKLGRILMNLRDEFRSRSIDYGDSRFDFICDLQEEESFPEWQMNTGMLKMIPQYHDAIDAYSATLNGLELSAFYGMTFEQLDIMMRTNMGGGMPVIGFYEMKQDVYDISRRLARQDADRRKRIDYCNKYIPVLQMIDNDPDLKQSCRDYSVYSRPERHESLIRYLYDCFMKEAYSAGIVIKNYMDIMESSGTEKKDELPSAEELDKMSPLQVLAYIAWLFRADHFVEGHLIYHSIAEGHMLRLLKLYAEKETIRSI